jgi:dihydrofolate reductase
VSTTPHLQETNSPPVPWHVTLIAAVAKNGVIGQGNQLPWQLSEDLKFFKEATLGHAIVMGRKTFESVGRPLPGRRNLVVSRDLGRAIPGVEFCGSLLAALDRCPIGDEVFITGGAPLFIDALPLSDRLLITEIERDYEGDTIFPAIPSDFKEVSRRPGTARADPSLQFAWVEYRRPTPNAQLG